MGEALHSLCKTHPVRPGLWLSGRVLARGEQGSRLNLQHYKKKKEQHSLLCGFKKKWLKDKKEPTVVGGKNEYVFMSPLCR